MPETRFYFKLKFSVEIIKIQRATYNLSQDIWDQLWFWCEIVHYEKSLISVFQEFFASINKRFVLAGDWALGYHSRRFGHFLRKVSQVHWTLSWCFQISWDHSLKSKSFSNSWGNSHIACLYVIIAHRLACGERKIW